MVHNETEKNFFLHNNALYYAHATKPQKKKERIASGIGNGLFFLLQNGSCDFFFVLINCRMSERARAWDLIR